MSHGILYIVATPIGNLEDVTLRALRILKEVDVIACEDTRHTKKLLSHYDIHTKTISFHAHSDTKKIDAIAGFLEAGLQVALVSDAGTPLVSDPGTQLVAEIRTRFGDDVQIVPIPGASALTAALSVVPVPGGTFVFYGFVPHKKGRATLVQAMAASEMASVVYESTHRIVKLLTELSAAAPNATIYLARELTKQFEEVLKGTPAELLDMLTRNPDHQKGEFVVIVCNA